jgi:hypothetical protein
VLDTLTEAGERHKRQKLLGVGRGERHKRQKQYLFREDLFGVCDDLSAESHVQD